MTSQPWSANSSIPSLPRRRQPRSFSRCVTITGSWRPNGQGDGRQRVCGSPFVALFQNRWFASHGGNLQITRESAQHNRACTTASLPLLLAGVRSVRAGGDGSLVRRTRTRSENSRFVPRARANPVELKFALWKKTRLSLQFSICLRWRGVPHTTHSTHTHIPTCPLQGDPLLTLSRGKCVFFPLVPVRPRIGQGYNWAHGVVVPHPLRMRKAPGSNPGVSISAA